MKTKIFYLTLALLFFITSISNNSQIKRINYGEINYSTLYLKILHSGVKFPDVVFAQALIESAHFNSEVFKCENNLFGMKQPYVRETTSLSEGKTGYASYFDWTHSVEDYVFWQRFALSRRDGITKSEYLNLLGRIYAEDPKYVKKIKQVISDHYEIFDVLP
jgi:hypothetical protein